MRNELPFAGTRENRRIKALNFRDAPFVIAILIVLSLKICLSYNDIFKMLKNIFMITSKKEDTIKINKIIIVRRCTRL